jgi:tRNA(Ile)-lysidine synthase TilS/MesJ
MTAEELRFVLHDRLGHSERLVAAEGDTVGLVLRRYRVPPTSVIVLQDGSTVVNQSHPLVEGVRYEARLIEGYDLNAITRMYRDVYDAPSDAALVLERLRFSVDGRLDPDRYELGLDDVVQYVESTVLDTCVEFDFFDGSRSPAILIGLSGGVDSTSLLLALNSLQRELHDLRIVTATFQDYDVGSPTQPRAAALAREVGVEHHLIPAELVQETFHLRVPLARALEALMDTPDSHKVMYVDHHTTRRALEVFGATVDISTIALGLHVTDLVAGLLNGIFTGYDVAPLPVREIGDVRYVYPLAFLHKRVLHLYYRARTGAFATHAHPNPWELFPQDRNFYYYLADVLQDHWPGLELSLFTAHRWRGRRMPSIVEEVCTNCGSTVLHQPFTPVRSDRCDVCETFAKHDLLTGDVT